MTKPDFSSLYYIDSGTKDLCSKEFDLYKSEAISAMEDAGKSVLLFAENNRDVILGWSFIPKNKTPDQP